MSREAFRVYVACSYSEIATARSLGAQLSELGFRVVSTWHDAPDQTEKILSAKTREGIWKQNEQDMELSQALIVPTLVGYPRSTFAEIGHVLALGEPAVVCDPRDHREMPLVCYAPRVTRCRSVPEGVAALVSIREAGRR